MKKLDIWCEGIADQKFLADVIQFWIGLNCTFSKKSKTFDCRNGTDELILIIREKGGKDAFTSKTGWANARKDLEDNRTIFRVKNLVILDADGDFQKRREEVNSATEGFIDREILFLWPDDREVGVSETDNFDLEFLLEQIMKTESKALFIDCWKGYEFCLSQKSNPKTEAGKFFVPDRKAMVYAFIEAFTGDSEQIKEQTRNYLDTDLWVLDGEKEPLKHLKSFLEKHIQNAV